MSANGGTTSSRRSRIPTPTSTSRSAMSKRPVLLAFFAVYLAALVWVVLWKLEPPHLGGDGERGVKLVPFVASDGFGASAPLEVAANVLLFAPFGAYLRLVAPRWRFGAILCVVVGASTALEVAQFLLAVGSSDTTDVIANAVGGAAGFGLVSVLRSPRLAGRVLASTTAACLIVIAVLLVAPKQQPPRLPLGGTTC